MLLSANRDFDYGLCDLPLSEQPLIFMMAEYFFLNMVIMYSRMLNDFMQKWGLFYVIFT